MELCYENHTQVIVIPLLTPRYAMKKEDKPASMLDFILQTKSYAFIRELQNTHGGMFIRE